MMTSIKIISWNIRGLNCQIKKGNVKWVLRRFSCDIAILLESKLEEVSRHITLGIWRRRSFGCLFRPSVGRSEALLSYGTLKFWSSSTPL